MVAETQYPDDFRVILDEFVGDCETFGCKTEPN